tara:strand:+ start:451 stop:774 length:324 start_codon:yes stop_codon:yes gene_type:complete
MIKISRIRTLIILLFFLNACSTVKEGFTNQKKGSNDEFLVEKKSPLVMPPDYEELPTPNLNKNDEDEDDEKVKKLLVTNENQSNEATELNNSNKSFQKSIIDKIKSD